MEMKIKYWTMGAIVTASVLGFMDAALAKEFTKVTDEDSQIEVLKKDIYLCKWKNNFGCRAMHANNRSWKDALLTVKNFPGLPSEQLVYRFETKTGTAGGDDKGWFNKQPEFASSRSEFSVIKKWKRGDTMHLKYKVYFDGATKASGHENIHLGQVHGKMAVPMVIQVYGKDLSLGLKGLKLEDGVIKQAPKDPFQHDALVLVKEEDLYDNWIDIEWKIKFHEDVDKGSMLLKVNDKVFVDCTCSTITTVKRIHEGTSPKNEKFTWQMGIYKWKTVEARRAKVPVSEIPDYVAYFTDIEIKRVDKNGRQKVFTKKD